MRRHMLPLLIALGCDPTSPKSDDTGRDDATPVYDACEDESAVVELLKPYLDGVIDQWQVVSFDQSLVERVVNSGGLAVFPAVTEQGEKADVSATVDALALSSEPKVAHTRDENKDAKTVDIPVTYGYTIGCDAADDSCGGITFFDPLGGDGEPTYFEGMLVGGGAGNVYFESAATLYSNLSGEDPSTLELDPSCGIVYNADLHEAIAEDIDLLTDEGSKSQGEDCGIINADVNIILDADATFYALSPSTVWSRQRSLFNIVQIMYALSEPILGSPWSLLLTLESQEAWTSGGPTETIGYLLTDELNDASYYMINPVENNEVSYFFLAYDLDSGLAGRAGGICNYPGYDDTWGSEEENQENHAFGQQVADADGYAFATLHGRQVVMMHELGHMFGAIHSDAINNAYRTNGVFAASGTTVMKSGAAGGVAPDGRGLFFTSENADNICACLDRVF